MKAIPTPRSNQRSNKCGTWLPLGRQFGVDTSRWSTVFDSASKRTVGQVSTAAMHRALFWLLLPAIAIASRYVIIQTTGIYSLFHAVVSPGYGARRGTCKSYRVFKWGKCRHIVAVRLCAGQSTLKKLNCCKSRGARAPVPHSWRRDTLSLSC